MPETPAQESSSRPVPKRRLSIRFSENEAKQWADLLNASGQKESDLVKSILFRRTLTVKKVKDSDEKLTAEVSRLVTELRSLQRELNDIEEKSKTSWVLRLSDSLEKLIVKSDTITKKILEKW